MGEEGLEEVEEDWGEAFETFGVGHWKCRTVRKKEGMKKDVCILCVILMKDG